VHTSIEHRRVSCRGVLISGCQKPYAQQASYPVEWCSRLLKMTVVTRYNALCVLVALLAIANSTSRNSGGVAFRIRVLSFPPTIAIIPIRRAFS